MKRRSNNEGGSQVQKILQRRQDRARFRKSAKQREAKVEDVVAQYPRLAKSDFSTISSFDEFPLSDQTRKGLKEAEYTVPTSIQRDSLAFSLTGSDLVAAAKTGSGKTLAFVVPLLECLWRQRWSRSTDGLGALIISPTRELALQTFNTINKVGKYHDFSCALLIGGTDVSFEKRRLHSMNIIVCTPGRLQQHMDETETFNCDNMAMLVVDEADRILDMGFAGQLKAIVANLPRDRQTLLFSATQTSDVKQVSRVCTKMCSLEDPVMVSVHHNATHATPEQLRQSYLICNEEEKVNILWSFITHHKHLKLLVFVSSCKQARFLTETFCHLRPGTSLMGLWGTMKQNRRLNVLETFERRKSACLIATDVASRGLDFEDIDWVVQMDAPPTVEDYIHRVGRSARMNKKGASILFLTPSQEEAMTKRLKGKKIPLVITRHDPKSIEDIRVKMQGVLAQFPLLNELAQKCVVAYLRSIHLMQDKQVFDVDAIDAKALAQSLGLVAIKRIRFLQKRKEGKKIIVKEEKVFDGHEFGKEEEREGEDEEDDALFTVKRRDIFKCGRDKDTDSNEKEESNVNEMLANAKKKKEKVVTKVTEAKSKLKRRVPLNTKIVYDEEGEEKERKGSTKETSKGLDVKKAMEDIKERDKEDKELWKERRKEKRREKLRKDKEKRKRERGNGDTDLVIAGSSDEDGSVDLSWLPDPDRKRNEEDEEEEIVDRGRIVASSEDESEEEVTVEPSRKRQKKTDERMESERKAIALLLK